MKKIPISGIIQSRMPIKTKINKNKDRETNTPEEGRLIKTKKVCAFCEAKTLPSFTDSSSLRRYLSDRAKIRPRARTGVCSKHQRLVTKQIKYARHLALLPFVAQI